MNPSFMTALLLTSVEVIGDVALKYQLPLVGFGVYNVLAYILFVKLKELPLGLVNGYWDSLSNILTCTLGMVCFKEKYTFIQLIGFALISIGVLLISKV